MIIAKVTISSYGINTKYIYVVAKDLERVLKCLKDSDKIGINDEIVSIDVIANEDVIVDKSDQVRDLTC